jgi:hypothetical protein
MRTYHFAGVLAIAGLVSLAFSEPARAITANLVLNDTTSVPNFSTAPQVPDISAGQIDYPIGNFFVGPAPGTMVARSPWEGELGQNTLQYTSVRDGSATYNMTGSSLSLFWGSPDTYNTLTFYTGLNGTGAFDSITGDELGAPLGTGHVLVLILTDVIFQSVKLSSTNPAFEFSNLVTPIPAALPLFATGLGMMGWLARRRRRRHLAAIAA